MKIDVIKDDIINYIKYGIGIDLLSSAILAADKLLIKIYPDKSRKISTRKIKTKSYIFHIDHNNYFVYRERKLFDTWRVVDREDFGNSTIFDKVFDITADEKAVGKMLEKSLKLKKFW